jgi:hypothetical protein
MLERTAKFTPKQFRLLCEALRHHGTKLRADRNHEALRVLTMFVRTLPTCAPYDVTISTREWPIVSRALRPEGMKPTPGSDAARWLALYQWMILPQNFYGMRSLSSRTQREQDRKLPTL